MSRTMILVVVSSLLVTGCKKSDTVVSPTPEPPGRQHDIPWGSLANSPWPMGHHDPQSTGRSPYVAGTAGQQLWEKQTSGRVSSAVIVDTDSTLYYESLDSAGNPVLCAVMPDGTLKWQAPLCDTRPVQIISNFTNPILSSTGEIYIISLDGKLYAINRDGSRKWAFMANSQILTRGLAIGFDGTLYFVSSSGTLYAVDGGATVKWTISAGQDFWWGETGPPIVFSPDGQTLYVGGSAEGVYAVSTSGGVRWFSQRADNDFYAYRLVDSYGNLYVMHGDTIISLSPSGTMRWAYPAKAPVGMTMDLDGNFYCVVQTSAIPPQQLLSLDYTGAFRWMYPLTSSWAGELVCDHEGTVYVGLELAKVFMAIRSDGTLKWSVTLTTPYAEFSSSPAIAGNGNIYVPTGSTNNVWNGIFAFR